MENRLRTTERKQQKMTGFLSKEFSTPEFLKKYAHRQQEHIEIGRKRRLTMTPSIENLQELCGIHTVDSFLAGPVEDESTRTRLINAL